MNLAYKKILGKFTKVLGFGKTPPPCWEKFPNNIVFFLEPTTPQALPDLMEQQLWLARWHFFIRAMKGVLQCNDYQKLNEVWTFLAHPKRHIYGKDIIHTEMVWQTIEVQTHQKRTRDYGEYSPAWRKWSHMVSPFSKLQYKKREWCNENWCSN